MHEEADGLLDPRNGRYSCLAWNGPQAVVDDVAHARQIRLSNELLATSVRAHVAVYVSVRYREEPLGSNKAKSPFGLTIEVSTEGMLGAPSLIRWMDAAHSPVAIPGGPLTILIGDVATLDLDDSDAAIRRQDHQVNLDVPRLAVAESQAMDENLTILKRPPEGLPDLPLGLGLEHRTLWNGLTPV